MKKTKVELEKQQSPYMGVQTRSKAHALQSLQTRSRKCKKVGGASSGEVKKRQKKGGSGSKSSKGKGKGKGKKKVDVVSDEERVVEEEGEINEEGMDDLGGVDDAGEDVGAEKGDVDRTAAITGGLPSESTDEHFSINSDYRAPCSSTKDAEFVADERPQTELGGDSHQHKEMTIEVLPEDFNLYSPTAPSMLNSHEHFSISSDYRTPCSSTKDAEFAADERPQTELGGNSHQHKEMTIDVLPEDFNIYSPTPPSMQKYNFDVENKKSPPGHLEWEKKQP
ncbi:hypothetical protein LIER_24722 [Lithospermum erythrorhizon]|uniref:Uncharacterized protein n=1 Tax=Lithospermum erythrorhizon TaxID=34254 RepID=A0AAV3R5E6_LITER